ncbi:TonB-dependent receptor plug domain-containing protein [Aliarcobacter cryaerophilus]|uniref:TonB-dependent receptor plug domain-containing protein n=1 Tax=Aliarcobacter cryaerophilus TaxID=28198 RepID=UPI0021B5FA33|nr:TonB-dependent receptor [Aliarcobacter cryaerophilus]MCT7542192.1 TonB-dependent receptor [Aliarcobacter cryaerophilus]
MYKQSLFASLALAMLSTNSFANEEIKKLNDIIVTSKSNQSIEDLSNTVTVITAEDIEKLNAVDIKDVLLKSAGMVEIGGGRSPGRTYVSIRGTRQSDTLFLVDGKRGNPTADYIEYSDFEYNTVPLSAIERIEIVKGAKSSIYGSDAMGGVVNIITKKDSRKIYGALDVRTGASNAKNGGDTQNYSANIGGNISDKLFMFLDVSKTNRDATGDNTGTFIEGLDSTSGITKLRYVIDDTQNIYASYLKGVDKRDDYKGPQTYKIERDIYSLGYEKSFEKVALSLDYTNAKTDTTSNISAFKGEHNLNTDTLDAEAKISAIPYNYLIVGAGTTKDKYERYDKATSIGKNFDRRANNYYIQDEIELGDFIFAIGTILDDNEKYGTEWSPNTGAVYKIDDKQRLKLNYSEGFKAPSLKEGDSGYLFDAKPIPSMNVIIKGNDDLKPETSKSYELAYEFYGEDTTFKAAVFRTDLKDMISEKLISRTTPPPFPIKFNYQYQNIDRANIKGFETDFKYNFNENHTFNANYTYIKTKDESTGDELEFRPKNTINLGLSSEFGWGISSYLSANYIGTQYYTDANNISQKASGYALFNAQVSKKLNKDLTATIGVNNIGDKNFDDSGYPYYIERRLAYVGINYKF